ncbi:MAG: phenylacetate-CoA oxygenase subunit PaaJ [Candidatus Eisenbacteria bacterium]|nr:phenylacetate-CoA oxygenase subunit PaaJ [Candidatus Eisenbacteria bacterium]
MVSPVDAPCDETRVREILGTVADPEIPALSVVELGLVRAVRWTGEFFEIDITPTYSGCPAVAMIEEEIAAAMSAAGVPAVVRRVLAPAWTTDWLSAEARRKLTGAGIAPPGRVIPGWERDPVACPHCGSSETELVSAFGSTACKALHRCRGCGSPFDHFKPL